MLGIDKYHISPPPLITFAYRLTLLIQTMSDRKSLVGSIIAYILSLVTLISLCKFINGLICH